MIIIVVAAAVVVVVVIVAADTHNISISSSSVYWGPVIGGFTVHLNLGYSHSDAFFRSYRHDSSTLLSV